MIFFINPISSLVQNFSEEKALLRAYLGLTESMSKPITNSVGEFQFYYRRFLGYLIHNLDNTIAEIEAADSYVEQQELDAEAEQAKADIFPEQEQPAPIPYSPQTTKPVAIRIEGDRLDTFTDILESATTGLDFKRSGDKVIVGIFGKEFFGVYGIKDNEIWIEYRLDSYFNSLNIDFEKILTDTDIEITITDSHTKQEAQAEYTPEETEAYDSVFGEAPPQPAPTIEDKIESPYSSKEEIAKIETAFNEISEQKNSTDSDENLEITPDPAPTSEANEVPVSENVESFQKPESDSTEQIFDELKSESLKERMLGAKNKAELEAIKAENPEAVTKLWDSLTIPEKNLIKCINSVSSPKHRGATPFDLVYWYDALGQKNQARYMGFYLHGQQIKNEDDRVIYLTEHDTFKVVQKYQLKAIAKKQQKPCPAELVAKLEAALSGPEDTEDTAPTAQEIADNNFTGLTPAKKHQTGTVDGNNQDSEQTKQDVEPGDLIRVTTTDSIAHGKCVEVDYVKPDGSIKSTWNNQAIFIPKSGYQLELKNLQNLAKKA